MMSLIGTFFLRANGQSPGYAPLPRSSDVHELHSYTKLDKMQFDNAAADSVRKSADRGTQSQSPDEEACDASDCASEASSDPEFLQDDHAVIGRETDGVDMYGIDVRGLAMLRHARFYQIWILLGLFSSIGLMTIK